LQTALLLLTWSTFLFIQSFASFSSFPGIFYFELIFSESITNKVVTQKIFLLKKKKGMIVSCKSFGQENSTSLRLWLYATKHLFLFSKYKKTSVKLASIIVRLFFSSRQFNDRKKYLRARYLKNFNIVTFYVFLLWYSNNSNLR
jgi:hypothetical protein